MLTLIFCPTTHFFSFSFFTVRSTVGSHPPAPSWKQIQISVIVLLFRETGSWNEQVSRHFNASALLLAANFFSILHTLMGNSALNHEMQRKRRLFSCAKTEFINPLSRRGLNKLKCRIDLWYYPLFLFMGPWGDKNRCENLPLCHPAAVRERLSVTFSRRHVWMQSVRLLKRIYWFGKHHRVCTERGHAVFTWAWEAGNQKNKK